MKVEERHLKFSSLEEAVDFSERTLKVYRKAVLQKGLNGEKPHHASLPHFRRGFIESYLVFKRFVLKNKRGQ